MKEKLEMLRNSEFKKSIKYRNLFILIFVVFIIALTTFILLRGRKFKPGNFDISYTWTPSLEKAIDALEGISATIEPDSANLHLVKRESDDYGIIYKLSGSKDSALALIESHNELLQLAELEPAEPIRNSEYHHLYNISYGIDPDIEVQKANYRKISATLGPGVTRDLTIESLLDGHQIIYRILSNEQSASDISERQSMLLESKELEATIVMDSRGDVVYGESSYLNELLENESLYNVSYGLGPNLEPQKKNYLKVAEMLGEEVARDLVIQKTPYGNYLLTYIRRKDEQSTRSVARKHSRLLRSKRLSAAVIRENSTNTIIYPEIYSNVAPIKPVEPVKPTKQPIKPEEETVSVPKEKPKTGKKPAVSKLDLQQQVQNYISELKRSGRLSSKDKVACSVYDFTTGEKLVSISEEEPLQCASMVKPLVALAFFHEVERGKLIYGRKSKRNMQIMIQRSGNTQTNWLMRHVGGPKKVQEILDTNYSRIFKNTDIKEFIPRGGETYLNRSSVHDYSRFLYAMWNGQLPHSRELRRLMALPNNDRVYRGAKRIPRGTLVYDKTGSTGCLIGNMAILVAKGKNGKRYPYTLICAIERHKKAPNYTTWKRKAENMIREISNKVYLSMKKKHNLI